MGVKKAPQRTLAATRAAHAELEELIMILNTDVTRLSSEVGAKQSVNEKIHSQIGKLTTLLNQLNAKKDLDAKIHEAAIAASTSAQKKITDDFSIFVPRISERINRVSESREAADKENMELREKLLAGADEFEARRARLLVEIGKMEATKKKIAVAKKEPSLTADVSLAQENDTDQIKTETNERKNSTEKSPSSEVAISNLEESEESATSEAEEEDEEAKEEAALLQQMEVNKKEFEAASFALYETELELRKKIIFQANSLTKLQEELAIANQTFQNQSSDIETLVQQINAMEKEHELNKTRLVELSAKVDAPESLTAALQEADKYDKLAQALERAIDAMKSSPVSPA